MVDGLAYSSHMSPNGNGIAVSSQPSRSWTVVTVGFPPHMMTRRKDKYPGTDRVECFPGRPVNTTVPL